jgi:hypothetical protein
MVRWIEGQGDRISPIANTTFGIFESDGYAFIHNPLPNDPQIVRDTRVQLVG